MVVPQLTDAQSKYLLSKYTNVNYRASFTSARNFFKCIKADGQHDEISLGQVKRFLATLPGYTLHREYRRPKTYRRVIAPYKLYCMSADLIDLQRISKHNNKKRYIMICQDLFTRRIFLKALANKKGKTVLKALKEVFKVSGKSKKFFSDRGKEFLCNEVQEWLKSVKIEPYTADDPATSKCSVTERTIRSLRGILTRFFTHHKTHRWYPYLSQISKIFNSSYHRVIKCTPFDAWSGRVSRAQVWANSYLGLSKKKLVKKIKKKKSIFPPTNFKYCLNDIVKVAQEKTIMSRSHDEKYSRENFRIETRYINSGIKFYKLKDLHNEEIRSKFRENEIKLSTENNDYQIYEVQKVLRKRTVQGERYGLILWRGLGRGDATWVKMSDLRDL